MTSKFTFVALCIFTFLPSCFGQFHAAVEGTVTDSSGAVVADTSVTLTSKETQRKLSVTTTGEGLYRFNGLAPGAYSIEAAKTGFKTATIETIQVSAEEVQAANLTLTTGDVAQSVTVSESAVPALATENADISTNITAAQVRALPQLGRDPYSLLRLTPGIFGDNSRSGNGGAINLVNTTGPGGSNSSIFQTENQVPISANGQRISQNNFAVDGVSVNSLTWGGAAVVTPNQESIKEMRINSAAYSAEYGRNAGAQINIISQNGTSTYHGSGVFKYDDPIFNAYNKYGGPGLPDVRVNQYLHQFAASVGGPVVKNHVFFFFSYEGLRNNSTGYTNQYIETPQFDQSILSQRANSVIAKVIQSTGNQPRVVATSATPCPPGFSATQCQVVAGGLDLGSLTGGTGTYTNTTGGGLDGIPDVIFAQIANPLHTQGNQYNGRVDWSRGNDSLMASAYVTSLNNLSSDPQGRPNQDLPFNPLNYLVTLNYNHIISPNILNEARANVTRFADNGLADSTNVQWGIPRLEVQDYNPLGARVTFGASRGDTSPGIFAENTFEVRDYVNWVAGKHAIKFGVENRWEQDNNNLLGGARPLYTFSGLWNLANSAPIYEAINANPVTGAPADAQRYYRTRDFAEFFQDDIRLRPNLTLNLGLRWEYFSPLSEARGRLTNIAYGSMGLENASVVPVSQLYKPDGNNFAPRLGIAYNPFPKLVVRAGFGMYYNRIPLSILANNDGNPPYFSRYGLCCGTSTDSFGTPFAGGSIALSLGNNINDPSSYPINPALAKGVNQFGAPNGGQAEVWGAQANTPNGYAYIYSFDVQYQLPASLVLDLGYQGSADRKLIRLVNENFLHTPSPNFSAFYVPQPDVDSNFNALLVTLSKRLSRGLSFSANYRFAKSLDNLSYEGPGGVTNQTYPGDNKSEYGPSDFDTPHNFTGSAVWEIPFTRATSGWQKAVLGGWTLSPIVSAHSGFPWTPKSGQSQPTPSGLSLGPSRPIAYNGGAGTDYSNSTFLQTNGNFPGGGLKFFTIGTGPPGIGRNSFRGPRYFSTDLSAAKVIKASFLHLGEAAELDVRANFFNLFNRLNLQPFNFFDASTMIDNNQFGMALQGLAGRTVEFQARLSF